MLIRPLVRDLHRVGSRETEDFLETSRRAGAEVLHLTGGPVVALPAHLREAMLRAFEDLHVSDQRPSSGLPALRHAICESLAAVTAPTRLAPDQVLITAGAMHALNLLARATLQPGDEVVIPSPNYFFDGVVRLSGGLPVHVPCLEQHRWGWDLERIERAITDHTRLVMLSNPTNPTGYLPSRQELGWLLELARSRGFGVVSDESYEAFVYEGAFTSLLSLPGWASNGVVVRSMSKSYALANWRVGYLAASGEVAAACTKVLEWDALHCAYVAQCVARAAIEGPREWLDAVLGRFRRGRDQVMDVVVASKWLHASSPPAGPFLFLDTTAVERAVGAPGADLLLAAGVPVVRGEAFHCPGHARLAFGGDDSTLARLTELLAAFDPLR